MRAFLGIDLGSTTSKAVLVDETGATIGRGITNTRSNYDVAAAVVRAEALIDAQLTALERALRHAGGEAGQELVLEKVRRAIGVELSLRRLGALEDRVMDLVEERAPQQKGPIQDIFADLCARAVEIFGPLAFDRARFFRDAAGAAYFAAADKATLEAGLDFDVALGAYDRAIVETENREEEQSFESLLEQGTTRADLPELVRGTILRQAAALEPIQIDAMVGTGYGRQRLPFPKENIQSEILCHGLGAHAMFPNTRTVLDIGGQDTKAIQLDANGLVTSFQMNDRCAAGCGRYLGYIADEMNLGVHELGPLALGGTRSVKISSTCTVFAGVELRELLSTGEKRENILLGLHRAIVLRAMSLLARSGGVSDEFTFTGGVAKNAAVVRCLEELVTEHYGARKLNIHTDSIYTGALGAALFAVRSRQNEVAA